MNLLPSLSTTFTLLKFCVIYRLTNVWKKKKSQIYKSKGGSSHLTVVEPESHVLLLDAESLGQVEVDVLDGAHAAEAAGVGQHPLQRSVGRRHVTC